jgi:hypothetical protein
MKERAHALLVRVGHARARLYGHFFLFNEVRRHFDRLLVGIFGEDGLNNGERERVLFGDAGNFLAFGIDGVASVLFVPLGESGYFLSLPS